VSIPLSKRIINADQPEIRNMSIECERHNGINLAQGVCDTEVHPVVQSAAQKAIAEGVNHYTRYDGVQRLREAIASKYKRLYNLDYDADGEIVVSGGSTGALYAAGLALLNPGDELIVFEPFYGYHLDTMNLLGVTTKFVRMSPPDWTYSVEDVQAQISERTRGIIINTPNNPTGKVYTPQEMKELATLVAKHDLLVFTDEIYEHFIYESENEHICFAALPGMKERTITISGLSKTFSITGWRIGYALTTAEIADAIGYFNDLVYVCAPAPLQIGAAEGILSMEDRYYEELREAYKTKRDMLCDALSDIGLQPSVPRGAYYILADIAALPGDSAKDKCMNLLRETGVAAVPGTSFYDGSGGENIARFCYAKDQQSIEEACRRLRRSSW